MSVWIMVIKIEGKVVKYMENNVAMQKKSLTPS